MVLASEMVSGTNGNRTLKLLRDITEFGEWREAVVKDGTKLGLISTKGAIHTGHLGLSKIEILKTNPITTCCYIWLFS